MPAALLLPQRQCSVCTRECATLQFHDGEHSDYHRALDTVEKINFPNMERILRTAYGFVGSSSALRTPPIARHMTSHLHQSRGLCG